MKKITSFICLTAVLTAVCFSFTGCFDDSKAADAEVTKDTSAAIVESTDKIITDYATCYIYLPNGEVVVGDVVSWTMVSDNLIQVSLVYVRENGSGKYTHTDEPQTYLVSTDRFAMFTD